ncbi:multidrug effflux MFS transporter [Rhizobium sp. P38BS-XIX]|uniref:multidrug effflux MFS transporter n=1 Tax=Rhizobium sp. P38BS-XIX TaxID=2726740 RepID=UPI0014579028|nr:multidrug effflux MFS transporter [Rhizobium sp. P38BS-XIX]NLR97706.1 multidrug effflux MFS transporter [Rhizobium sp. P38BS-XIX]
MSVGAQKQTSQATTTGIVSAAHTPLWILALITLSGTLAMHIFVPALPLAAAALGATPHATQLTLSAYIIGLALGQLVYGPVSDRYGRRPVLIAGLLLYTAASLGALLSPTIDLLIIARLLQAIGGCSGLVLGRAIVRDGASGPEAARKLSLMNLMTMAGPGLSPLIGGALAETTGWRSIFVALTLLGVANLTLVVYLLRETPGRQGHDARQVVRYYLQLLRSRAFLGYTIGGGCATTSVYAYIGAAPFIFADQLHRPISEVGAYLAINIAGIWFGSLAASRIVGRMAMTRVMIIGNLISCIAAFVFLTGALTGMLDVILAVTSMLFFSFGAGIASPAALAETLSVNPQAAGSASGLYGAAQMAIGAVCTALGGLGDNPALAAGSVLLGTGIMSQLSFWIANRSRTALAS